MAPPNCKGHLSYETKSQMHWNNKIYGYFFIAEGVGVSLEEGCYYIVIINTIIIYFKG